MSKTTALITELDREKYGIKDSEVDTILKILVQANTKTLDEFMAVHPAKFQGNPYLEHVRWILEDRLKNYIPKIPKVCDCGAKHTSFKQIHYSWCKTQEK